MQVLSLSLLALTYASFTLAQNDCFGEGFTAFVNINTLTKGADNFALKIFKDMATSHFNHSIVISPYSVWSVLGLAYLGADMKTKDELSNALGIPSKTDAFYGRGALEMKLKLNKGTSFNNADFAYFDESLTLNSCVFNKIVSTKQVNFRDSDSAVTLINEDVSKATKGKINRFVNANILRNAEFVLINAIYFKGTWEYQFRQESTAKRPFYDSNRKKKLADVDMMTVEATLNYATPKGLQASILELPYTNSNISMLVILPDVRSTVNEVMMNLTSDYLDQIVSEELKERKVVVLLPRFKWTTKIADEIKQALVNLGIVDLFDRSSANLSKFTKARLFVDKVLHQSTIEVTEEGTVATGVTGLIGTRSGTSNVVNFVANRPFSYLIRDNHSGITLFAGVFRSPTF